MPIAADVYKKIVDAKLFIDAHFDTPIDLDAIAGEACLSRYHFHRLFRRIYQRTPHQYLTRKRIDQARRLLTVADCTVNEVCAQVGFERRRDEECFQGAASPGRVRYSSGSFALTRSALNVKFFCVR